MTRMMILVAAAALTAAGQHPAFENARIETRAAGSDPAPTIHELAKGTSGPAWVGYAVPIVAGERRICGWDGARGEQRRMSLEGPKTVYVLYRVEPGRVSKVRTATPDCGVDAGGLTVIWLTGVAADASVSFLETLVTGNVLSDGALSAIALHDTPAADHALDAAVSSGRPLALRRKAVFWLGVARGQHGYDKLTAIVRSDVDDKLREHAIFALSQSKQPGAIKEIVRSAHEDKSPHVRGQALFWLAQKAERTIAADAIASAIANDPEAEVKRRAVFALSRVPDGEGVSRLIEVAQSNRNPAVRKQAIFWLGQSKDPRALDYLEKLLTR